MDRSVKEAHMKAEALMSYKIELQILEVLILQDAKKFSVFT